MRSFVLQSSLRSFAQDAANVLQVELDAGAEMPFQLVDAQPSSRVGAARARRHAALRVYRPLSSDFIDAHSRALEALPSFEQALSGLEGFDALPLYLTRRSRLVRGDARHGAHDERRAMACAALHAFIEDVFDGQSDFELHPRRFESALRTLDAATFAEGSLTVLAQVHGLAIVSEEVRLAHSLALTKPSALTGAPRSLLLQEGLLSDARGGAGQSTEPLILLLSIPKEELGCCEAPLRDALRALRLFGGGGISLDPLAWIGEGEDTYVPLPLGFARRSHGVMLLAPDQEDELRAFASLVATRAPYRRRRARFEEERDVGTRSSVAGDAPSRGRHATATATDATLWALRRFELGCEAPEEWQGLTDHLLALEALLEPSRREQGLLAARLSALCAPPAKRSLLTERMLAAIELERDLIAGEAQQGASELRLVREVSEWLRALLSDVICGHLKGDLAALASELLLQGTDETTMQAPPAAGVGVGVGAD